MNLDILFFNDRQVEFSFKWKTKEQQQCILMNEYFLVKITQKS